MNAATHLVKPGVKFVKLESVAKLVKVDTKGSNPDPFEYFYNTTWNYTEIENVGYY